MTVNVKGVRQPVSQWQRGMMAAYALAPESQANVGGPLYRVTGPLDLARLQRALDVLTARHPHLRTTFHTDEQGPYAWVREEGRILIETLNTTLEDEASLDAEAARWLLTPLRLDQAPPFHVLVVLKNGVPVRLALGMHHLLSDAGGLAALMLDLGALYAGQESLPPLTQTPTDFVHAEAEWLVSEKGEKGWAYWQEQLGGVLPVVALPYDRPRAVLPLFRGGTVRTELPPTLAGAVFSFAREGGHSTFDVLLGSFEAWVSRLSGTSDVLVLVPTRGRLSRTFKDVFACCANPVLLRAQVDGQAPFTQVIQQARRSMRGALRHSDFPYFELTERLASPARGGVPLAQVCFDFLPVLPIGDTEDSALTLYVEGVPLHLGDLHLESRVCGQEEGQVEFALSVIQYQDRFLLAARYDAELFDRSTVEALVQSYVGFLEAALRGAELPVSSLPLLSQAQAAVLTKRNADAVREVPHERSFAALFEEQVLRTPEATALVGADRLLSYGALAQESAQLAWTLRDAGVGPEVRVALLSERNVEWAVGTLAVLRAQGAFVPLDPAYPAQRVAEILRRSGARVVLCAERQRPLLDSALALLESPPPTVVSLTPSGPERAERLPLAHDPHQLAYVIFTSGSTGAPKGAMVEQRGMVNHLFAKVEALALTSADRVAQTANACFDISIWQVLVAWLVGAQTHVLGDAVAHHPRALDRELKRVGMTVVELVPSMLGLMLESGWSEASLPPSLRWMIATGEALSAELCARWFAASRVPLMNAYGPTECSDDVTHHVMEKAPTTALTPIGVPVLNTALYVLDAQQETAGPGCVGELCVGGVGVGRGYLEDPATTAQVFIPDPFSGQAGARLYRTGDLARWRPDGSLEFLGRRDHQVKVRGFRIELAEVEWVLAQQKGVREAVVVAEQVTQAQAQLVAYVAGGALPDAGELRQALTQRLPAYMVPSRFVFLPSLPLSANGKVDRQALSQLSSPKVDEAVFVPPQTDTEKQVAALWAAALKVPAVGRTSNFFELGGHSLRATQVLESVRRHFSVELPLRTLFEAPSLEAFSAQVDVARASAPPTSAPLVRRGTEDQEVPLSSQQQWYWFLQKLDPNSSVSSVSLLYRFKGPLNADLLERAFGEVVRRQQGLRITVRTHEGLPFQQVQPETFLKLRRVDLSSTPASEREATARARLADLCAEPFTAEGTPLLRVELVRLQEQESWLCAAGSHLLGDGAFSELFLSELSRLYQAFSAGQPSPLAELPVQYLDFVPWQEERFASPATAKRLDAWRERLAGASLRVELPFALTPQVPTHFRGQRVLFSVDPALAAALKRSSQEQGVSLFMTLLAGFNALLSRYTGLEDLVVVAPSTLRTREELAEVMGHFVGTVLLRSDLSGSPSFEALLARTRETVLWALAHQEVPGKELVKAVLGEGKVQEGQAQVSFGLLSTTPPRFTDALKVEVERPFNDSAMYPLSLDFWDDGEALTGELRYREGLYSHEAVEQMVGHLLMLLRSATQQPREAVRSLPFLTRTELDALLPEPSWRGSPQDEQVQSLFEAQARRSPEALAVRFGEQELSYAALDAEANALAQALQRRGVGPEKKVALCLSPSLATVVAPLAVLKSGGAYVPLDVDAPDERLVRMLALCGAEILITQEAHRERLSKLNPGTVLCVDGDRAWAQGLPSTAPLSQSRGENLAYVVFTSGSTGEPKGVQVSHASVVNHNRSVARQFDLKPEDRVLQFTPLHFDAAGEEIYPPLLSGAAVVVLADLVEPARFNALVASERLSVLSLPPAYLHLWVNELAERSQTLPSCLRLVILGGEKLLPETRALFERVGGASIPWLNVYGPTEATVTAALARIASDTPRDAGLSRPTLPIGRPIDHAWLYLVDAQMQLVPPGHPGELLVAGAGLARGYLERADLTAERFVPDPFSQLPGARLYRTGDVARMLPSGALEFVGRVDHQVKIRGFRVEPGDIEAALRAHPHVKEVTVLAREEGGQVRLAAYVVPAQTQSVSRADLRQHLRARVPDYMIPADFVLLDALPLTSNGKVNRRALPAPVAESDVERAEFVGPRDATEAAIAAVFSEVLGVMGVGIHDDFFALGGHSLLATQLTSQLLTQHGLVVQLRDLFEHPTVAGLAGALASPRVSEEEALLAQLDQMNEDALDDVMQELERLNAADASKHS